MQLVVPNEDDQDDAFRALDSRYNDCSGGSAQNLAEASWICVNERVQS